MTKILIVILIVVILAVVVTMRQGVHYREFMKTAEKVGGYIVSKEERRAGKKNTRKEYWVTYSYTDHTGIIHTTSSTIEYPDLWQHLRDGQAELVYYDKNNPSESYLAVVLDRRMGIAGKLGGR